MALWLKLATCHTGDTFGLERTNALLACFMASITLSEYVSELIGSRIPLEILTISALWHLACSTDEEVAELGIDSNFIGLIQIGALLTLGREGTHAFSASLIAWLAIVILVVTPVAIGAHFVATVIELVVASVAGRAIHCGVWSNANLARVWAAEAFIEHIVSIRADWTEIIAFSVEQEEAFLA